MDLALLEEKLSNYGSGGYYLIESFIIKVLQAEAKNRGQNLIYQSGNNIAAYDAIAPDGFAEILGPVAIEIVRSFNPQIIKRELDRHLNLSPNGASSLLLISIGTYPTNIKEFIEKNFPSVKNIFFWGQNELQELINRHPNVSADVADNLFTNRFRIALEVTDEDWKEQRKNVVAATRESYMSGRFSMLLGAGVS